VNYREQDTRVQEAEELAKDSKQQLTLAMDRISELEAELADLKKLKDSRNNTSGGKGKKSATRKTSSKTSDSPIKKKLN